MTISNTDNEREKLDMLYHWLTAHESPSNRAMSQLVVVVRGLLRRVEELHLEVNRLNSELTTKEQ